jgi:hypothetical protein
MEIEVKETIKIPEGQQKGKIAKIEYRTEPYKYTDLIIMMEDGKTIKYGVPTSDGSESKLMKLLKLFSPIEIGSKVDPELILLNKDISFEVKEDDKGFTQVVHGSIKPN